MAYLDELRFNLVGYGCTTCIGNSGPLPEPIGKAIKDNNLVAVSVLSGNRNFEGRINPQCARTIWPRRRWWWPTRWRAAWISTSDQRAAGQRQGRASRSTCATSGRRRRKWSRPMRSSVTSEMFRKEYADVFTGDAHWQALPIPEGDLYAWDGKSTYIKDPPYFEGMPVKPGAARRYRRRCGCWRCSATASPPITSLPPGRSPPKARPGKYLIAQRRAAEGFQLLWRAPRQSRSDDARHVRQHPPEKSARARHRRRLDAFTCPSGEKMYIYDAAMKYRDERVPLMILAGKEYGSGSSRDWAAKGTDAARRARGAGRELRAHPSQQPGGHGRAAAGVSAGRKREIPRA